MNWISNEGTNEGKLVDSKKALVMLRILVVLPYAINPVRRQPMFSA